MSMAERFALAIPVVAGMAFAADGPGLGKPISEADLAKWDISVPPDGKGLPSGSGTPAQGADIYAQKCEVCHGKDGVGGTNAALANPPGKSDRTMALYVPNATTIFDFTRRAMPWPQPKTLANDEVYALTAYILARAALIRYPTRRRTRTARRAEFEPASSTYSVLNRTHRVAGSYGRSASRGRKPKLACRTLPTTSAGW